MNQYFVIDGKKLHGKKENYECASIRSAQMNENKRVSGYEKAHCSGNILEK